MPVPRAAAFCYLQHGRTALAIKLLDLIKGTEPAGILPGTTLNHVAALFHVPTGWSLPWTSPFGGSIDYGDLSLDVAVLGRDVVITSIGVRLWDLDFSDVADARRVARPRPRFKRSARLDLQGITGGMTRDDVRTWLGKREIGFREFENTHDAFEETWQIIANKEAGLMVREQLSNNSRHIFFQVFPNNNPRNKNNGG